MAPSKKQQQPGGVLSQYMAPYRCNLSLCGKMDVYKWHHKWHRGIPIMLKPFIDGYCNRFILRDLLHTTRFPEQKFPLLRSLHISNTKAVFPGTIYNYL